MPAADLALAGMAEFGGAGVGWMEFCVWEAMGWRGSRGGGGGDEAVVRRVTGWEAMNGGI